jgi:2-amino-4-hydroxy-6-hydroxymethyldihydropteridine diphosphokinase|tara:strand:- start:12529 stop:13131 length:603 start_codon:yes stop_codon:yes gene_type:complete
VKTFGKARDDGAQIGREALIALGGNQSSVAGGPADTVMKSLKILENMAVQVVAVSPLYSTHAYPPGSGPNFVNTTARIRFDGEADQILAILHAVEGQLGRERTNRWGPRTVDLDLIAMGDTVLPDAKTQALWRKLAFDQQSVRAPNELILPHPRLQDRAFVLVPLADIAPDWRHPLIGKTVREMLNDLPEADKKGVWPME